MSLNEALSPMTPPLGIDLVKELLRQAGLEEAAEQGSGFVVSKSVVSGSYDRCTVDYKPVYDNLSQLSVAGRKKALVAEKVKEAEMIQIYQETLEAAGRSVARMMNRETGAMDWTAVRRWTFLVVRT